MGIPNAELLYNNEDMIYGEKGYRPKSSRLNHVKDLIVNKIAEEALKKVPNASGNGIISNVYNATKGGLTQTFSAAKHKHGSAAFDNPIPGVNKVFQNGWSLYHMKDGTTTINSVYTVERGGHEYAMAIETDGQSLSAADIDNVAFKVQGNEAAYHNQIITSGHNYPDKNVSKAKVYEELTDGDLAQEGVIDVERIPPIYQDAEIALFGAKGKRKIVGHTSAGEKIVRYEKPSKADFFKFYFAADIVYTGTSLGAKPAEVIFQKMNAKAASQELFENEALGSVNYIVGDVAGKRSDGYDNPLAIKYKV